MRILIDIQALQNNSRVRGIGRYASGLLRAMLQSPRDHDIYLLVNGMFEHSVEPLRASLADLLPADRFLVFDGVGPAGEIDQTNSWRVRASEMLRERLISQLAPDVVLVTTLFDGGMDDTVVSVGVLPGGVPTAVVFYDLIPLVDPDKYLGYLPTRQWYERKVESLKRADLLLSISNWSRQEAVDLLGVAPDRVVNISSAAGAQFAPDTVPPQTRASVLQRHGIVRPYLMHSSALDERKNFEGLITAFGALPPALRRQYQLVLVCKIDATGRQRLKVLAERSGLQADDLVLTGHVDDEALIALYTDCHLFVFPSFQEGFGLPPLEAMACGTPAITSSATSIPEVIELDEAMFDPRSTQAMSALIERALTDAVFYQRLVDHAGVQAKRFSWARTADRALDAMERMVAHKAPDASPAPVSQQQLLGALVAISTHASPTQDDLAGVARAMQHNEDLVSRTTAAAGWQGALSWRVEGPFDSSYSLALLNRETARALQQLGHHVVLHSTEGPGDFAPNPAFLAANPDLAEMHSRVPTHPHASVDVVSRILYPPRVADMSARVNLLHHYAWEETGFPQAWMDDFNRHLSGMTCLSRHVHKVMLDNGLHVPATVSGCGVDHWEQVQPDASYRLMARRFRFLHVSSCFPRKGVDRLLDAFGLVFSASDDVELVIKTFPNPHNEVGTWLAERRARDPHFPRVQVIEQDLGDAQLKALYQQCHVLVAPSRAEGFGLPMAEAMLSGLPVITTAWGGQLDFCNPSNAWLVDYRFERARSHFGVFSSAWAEPDVHSLADALRQAYHTPEDTRAAMALAGRELLLREFSWRDTAARAVNAARWFANAPPTPTPRIAWLTTWNALCGVASYSRNLIEAMDEADVQVLAAHEAQQTAPDEPAVVRCWTKRGPGIPPDLGAAMQALDAGDFNTVVIQFNYNFFDFDQLNQLVRQQVARGRRVVFMMHSTSDPPQIAEFRLAFMREALALATRVLVHTVHDLNNLKALGLVDNVALFPQAVRLQDTDERPAAANATPIVAAYGFCLPHKGLPELVEAAAILQSRGQPVRLRLLNAHYPDPASDHLVRALRDRLDTLGHPELYEMDNTYMTDAQSHAALSEADLVVFPYQETGESSSAAVRYGLSVGRPVAVTPLPIFDELDAAVFRFDGVSPHQIADGIERSLRLLREDAPAARDTAQVAQRWREQHDVKHLARRLHNLCVGLLR